MQRPLAIIAVSALIVFWLVIGATPAESHERRNVGPYQFVVGWLEEPAFLGVTNAVSLAVTDARSTPPKAVEGLEKTLTVDVFQGGSTTAFSPAFRTRFGVPGSYAADLVPTREGSYRFVIKGKIENVEVNEVFESGPGRFDEIKPVSALQYPDKVPAGAELSRTLNDIRSTAEQMRLIAITALVLGVIAVALPFIRKRT